MADIEKVIKGLECCTGHYTKCDTCPYWEHPGTPYCHVMKCEALELLKEQQEIINRYQWQDGDPK